MSVSAPSETISIAWGTIGEGDGVGSDDGSVRIKGWYVS